MTFHPLFAIVLILPGILTVATMMTCSPLGYEDESGFHYGKPRSSHGDSTGARMAVVRETA
jgi:hypothetical protein